MEGVEVYGRDGGEGRDDVVSLTGLFNFVIVICCFAGVVYCNQRKISLPLCQKKRAFN